MCDQRDLTIAFHFAFVQSHSSSQTNKGKSAHDGAFIIQDSGKVNKIDNISAIPTCRQMSIPLIDLFTHYKLSCALLKKKNLRSQDEYVK